MGVVELNKEHFVKVRVIGNTFYQDMASGEMKFAKAVPPKMERDKDAPGGLKDMAKHNILVVNKDLTIETARKLVQAQKAAPIYAPGKKPKEV